MKNILLSIFALVLIVGCTQYIENDPTFDDKFENLQGAYKEALFATGKNKIDAADKFSDFEDVWKGFHEEYSRKAVNEYSQEGRWKYYMKEMNDHVLEARESVDSGNISSAHESLEGVRDLWQELFKRNEVDNMMYRMTAFHNTMEETYEKGINDGSEAEVKSNCDELNSQWKEIAKFKPSGDEEFQRLLDAEQYNIDLICDGGISQVTITEAVNALKTGYTHMYEAYG